MRTSMATVTLEEVYGPVETQVQAVPATILRILSTSNQLSTEVIEYFFSGKGKLLRPALTLLGAEAIFRGQSPKEGTVPSDLLDLAASFEIFHAATLIHDDIIDASYLRRNLPTVNAKWGAQTAVLVGDYLHDKSMGTIFRTSRLTPQIFTRFLETAGIVCDGEIHELKEKNNFSLRESEYYDIIDKKTASLLACALECGARFAGATESESKALREFGHYFGLAFQIIDDCLDFTGNEHEFGKTLGADCMGGVLTLPLIRLLSVLQEREEEEVRTILASAEPSEKFETILTLMRRHETVAYAYDKARQFSAKARQELSVFKDSPAKRSLSKLLDYVLERQR